VGWFLAEDEIESWYEEAREDLDIKMTQALEADLHDKNRKKKYQRDLHALRVRYEKLHERFHRREKRKKRIHASFPLRLWRWLQGLPARVRSSIMHKLGRDEEP